MGWDPAGDHSSGHFEGLLVVFDLVRLGVCMVSLHTVSFRSAWLPYVVVFRSLLVCLWWSYLVSDLGLYVGHVEVMYGDSVLVR